MKTPSLKKPSARFVRDAKQTYDRLLDTYGKQAWWPAQSRFEIIIGAILGQNTAWVNVEKAIANLTSQHITTAYTILATPIASLAEFIRPSGFFNVKAKRLRAFCQWFCDVGGFDYLETQSTTDLRQQLLSLHGIGAETADDILLYCLARPVFVIDAYTRRIFSRLGTIDGKEPYEQLRYWFENSLASDVNVYQQYHALIVEHAKQSCRTKPICDTCCLTKRCYFYKNR